VVDRRTPFFITIYAASFSGGREINMNFRDKIFIISGTNSGIGKTCAELLLEKNATVIGLDLENSSINHEKHLHYRVDIREEQRIASIIEEVYDKYRKIDGLANCAGIYASSKPFYDINIAEWNKVIETNLTGTFILSKYVSKKMIQHKNGKIVNISCIRSKIFRPNMAEYAASKGGVNNLTSVMALDLSPYNIRVNSVAPGFTYTGMTAESFNDSEERRFSESIIPVGRIATPIDIANVVLFLFSDMSDYINGETIFVDGGYKIAK
jgi:NAD(P)-dependent dehydrogenase (short-subunit alcohol dehydrogenase family)